MSIMIRYYYNYVYRQSTCGRIANGTISCKYDIIIGLQMKKYLFDIYYRIISTGRQLILAVPINKTYIAIAISMYAKNLSCSKL